MQINNLAQVFNFYKENGSLPLATVRPMGAEKDERYRHQIDGLFQEAHTVDNSDKDFNLETGQVACGGYTCAYTGDAFAGNLSAVRSKMRDREFHLIDAQPAEIKGLWVWWDQHGPVRAQAYCINRERPDLSTVQEVGWVHGRVTP